MVDKVIGRAGDKVDVAVRIVNNPGIVGMRFCVGYDPAVLTPVDAQSPDFAGVEFGPYTNPLSVIWLDAISPNNTADGTVALLTFTVANDAPAGEYPVSLSLVDETDIFNADLQPVDFELVNGSVQVYDGMLALSENTANVGQTVSVELNTVINPGIAGMRVAIGYDPAVLTLIDAQGKDFAGVEFGPLSNPLSVIWLDAINANNTTVGTVAVLTFKIAANAPAGTYPLSISVVDENDIFNAELKPVNFAMMDGAIHVTDTLPGDVDNNGVVNVRDLGTLQRYLNGWDIIIHTANADVNADGIVNVRDYGLLQQYLNGWDVELKPGSGSVTENVTEDGYSIVAIDAARNAETGTKVQVSGVVAGITYAFGKVPSGVILADDTASIYVYGKEIAAACKVGNTITVKADKTYWILEDEMYSAEKFGYLGCNQLENAILVDNDKAISDFNKDAIKATTVKEIMDTPVSEDITSQLFKVTALVTKAPGSGFTNYYINDLDGTTGSYVYTQCNGSDFAWLDAFDGKVCTVYLTALNAKSSASGCIWRFLPVAVQDDNFDPASVNVAEFAVKYYGLGQFLPAYTGNPALALCTEVSSELLGFQGATLSYTSSDEAIATITDGVLNCLATGTVTITVTGTYGDQTYSADVTIDVDMDAAEEEYPNVKQAIAAGEGEVVTVHGIVGPSLVNKVGFYLIDETGVIAVQTTAAVMETIEIGQEVVIEATRAINTATGKDFGQICLKDAEILLNKYGTNAYPTDAFAGDITVEEFYNLPVGVDYTTSVFTMKATVLVEGNAYYTNISLTDGTTSIRLYCSSAAQYAWLQAYAGQEVTMEIAACNWNSKNYYTGCVLSVILEDGTKVYNTLYFD